jgi:hypothetical protein
MRWYDSAPNSSVKRSFRTSVLTQDITCHQFQRNAELHTN